MSGRRRPEGCWHLIRGAAGGGRPRGFTLLEVLVAITILAGALAILMQLFSADMLSITALRGHAQALAHAEGKMEALLAARRAPEAKSEGWFDERFRWVATAEPFEAASSGGALPAAYALKVDVFWREGAGEKQYALATVGLFPVGGGNP